MATLRELIIKISANSQSFQTEIARASRMGSDYYKTMQNGGRQAAAASRETQKAISDLTAQLSTAKSTAMSFAGAFGGMFATSQLVQYADTWNMMSGRLRLASTSAADFASAQQALFDISQRTGTSLEANTQLYSRIAQGMRDAGYASEDVAKVTETVATSLKLSGASAQETAAVVSQLSQALQSGTLSGDEFKSVMENGGRLAKLLADGLGVTTGQLKAMAKAQQLTTDKIIPLLTNVDLLRKEFAQLPATVSGSAQKVENAFMAWVGGADQASGATATLAGGLDFLANNIDAVAAAGGALVAVGVSRYFGNMVKSAGSATASLISAAKAEVNLAVAQEKAARSAVAASRADVYRAQQALQRAKSDEVLTAQQERVAAADAKVAAAQVKLDGVLVSGTATEKTRAKTALERAQAGLVAAKNADAQAVAERRLAAAQSGLGRNKANLAAAQGNLGKLTSVGSRLMSGLGGLTSLLGGIPGILMLGATAWYSMYEAQEQARKSAQEYAEQIDQIREKTAKMSLPEAADTAKKTQAALDEQNRLIDIQKDKIAELQNNIETLNKARSNKQYSGLDADLVKGVADATEQLAVEQERLNQMQDKARDIQSALEGVEHRRVSLLRSAAAEQNAAYQSLLVMNGQHSEFNRLLSLGNDLLQERQGLANTPMRIPSATLTDAQKSMLDQSRQAVELSKLKGEARARRQAEFDADKAGLHNTPEYVESRNAYINNQVETYKNNEANKPARKGPKSDAEKAADTYERLVKQQKEQLALNGKNTELAKLQYQLSEGELNTLTDTQKQNLLYNAGLIEQVKIKEELASYEKTLADSNATARASHEAELTGYGQGERMRSRMKEMLDIRTEFERKNAELQSQFQEGKVSEDLYAQELELNKKYYDERLTDQEAYYSAADAMREDFISGANEGFANWADSASDYASQASEMVSSSMSGLMDNISSQLSGNKVSWADWALSISKMMSKILLQAMMVNSFKSMSGMGGWMGSVGGFMSGLFKNAKGGVYDSRSLSAYSNQIVSTPTFFAFAKGAGLMGEAGPEAIMPLTRSADGSLGVRMVGGRDDGGASGGIQQHITQVFNISGNGDETLKQAMALAAKRGAESAIANVRSDFATNGSLRRQLGV